MSTPIVTVCIATYNQNAWIEQCLRSVIDQDVDAELNILVGDDASTDGTSDIVAKLALEHCNAVQHLCRNKNMGPLDNMRDLLTHARGDFVARVDGDDYWLPGKLQQQLRYLQTHADCAAVFTNAITVDANGDTIGLFNDVRDARFNLASMVRRGNFLNNSSILLRHADLVDSLRVTVPQIDYRGHLWLARRGWLGHIGEPLVAYRVNVRGSMIATMNDRVRELYWEAIQSVPRDLIRDADFARGTADFLRRVFYHAVRKRRWGLLSKWLPRVMAASPYGRTSTVLLTAESIARIAAKEGIGLFRHGPNGRRLKVLYRR